MAKPINSIKHKATRPHTPSTEEAGMEGTRPPVTKEYPLNPIIHRGQDPELMWMNKYGEDGAQESEGVDIRSLYRHEHIRPEHLISQLAKQKGSDVPSLFGNAYDLDELDKPTAYYNHQNAWENRLIQGDSLLVMTSLAEREGLAGKVQCIYIDPPYGIKYGSNWQMQLNSRNMSDGQPDEQLTGEPEMIKAYRDTWELGIHSYLCYMRDRLLAARELLTENGSCFVQISDENMHLVRSLMDEVFGSGNFCSFITFRKKLMPMGSDVTEGMSDYIIWYSKNRELVKSNPIYKTKNTDGDTTWSHVEFPDGTRRRLTKEEWFDNALIPKGGRVYTPTSLQPAQYRKNQDFPFEYQGRMYQVPGGVCWKTDLKGMEKLRELKRLHPSGNSLRYILYHDDYPVMKYTNLWADTSGAQNAEYVVQTSTEVIKRCILMTTDPGDLVLDPTCGSGTTAYVAEQWGRRWITIDTSRIALNIAKTRLTTAVFPWYLLHDEAVRGLTTNGGPGEKADVRNGFVYKTVPHITLKSLANDEPPATETLYDQPKADPKRIRVSGPFTVETLQSFEPMSPEAVSNSQSAGSSSDADGSSDAVTTEAFVQRIFEQLKASGIKNGLKEETAKFIRIEPLASPFLHAEGFYGTPSGEKKAYLHTGPQFAAVSKQAVNEAVKECRTRSGADWLIILGFAFEDNVSNTTQTTSLSSFEVTKVRMADDLLQEGLLKKQKGTGAFMTIGEPDIRLHREGDTVTVEVAGMDLYDPIRDVVKSFNRDDIAYWAVDDDYDESSFIVRQLFFCGGDGEYDKWRRALEKTLKISVDDEVGSGCTGT